MTTKEQVAKDEHSVSLTLCFMVDQDISKDDALCKTKKSVYLNLLKNKHSKRLAAKHNILPKMQYT